jgi:hypothetical protein
MRIHADPDPQHWGKLLKMYMKNYLHIKISTSIGTWLEFQRETPAAEQHKDGDA